MENVETTTMEGQTFDLSLLSEEQRNYLMDCVRDSQRLVPPEIKDNILLSDILNGEEEQGSHEDFDEVSPMQVINIYNLFSFLNK